MDARAYLTRQGWQGDGHSLDHTGKGIKRPLLVSKKVDVLGVGLNKHTAVSDQWWLRAFDQGLKDLGTGKESMLSQVQKHGVNRGGLYGRFVKGDNVPGTIEDGAEAPSDALADRKRKRVEEPDSRMNEKRARMIAAEAEPEPEPERKIKSAKPMSKQERGREKREQKRAMKAAATGEDISKELKKSQRKEERRKERKAARAVREAERKAKRVAAEAAKKEKKRKETAKPQAVELPDGGVALPVSDAGADGPTEFDTNADEVKLDMNGSGAASGTGEAKRYATKAEKRAKKEKAKAAEQGDADEDSKMDTVPAASTDDLSEEKLASYTKRAAKKGMTVEEYMQQRKEKKDKSAEQSDESPNGTTEDPAAGLTFMVDTAGDTNLSHDHFTVTATTPEEFSQHAIAAIRDHHPVTILDATGTETFRWVETDAVPLDPRIWDGIRQKDIKTLPKLARKARRDWMESKREEKKARKNGTTYDADKKAKKKEKGQRKVEQREAFVKHLLRMSRQNVLAGGSEEGTTEVGGVKNVPMIKVKTTEGKFTKEEVSLARTVSRRTIRNAKREEKAEQGKGKGWKKREREENSKAGGKFNGSSHRGRK